MGGGGGGQDGKIENETKKKKRNKKIKAVKIIFSLDPHQGFLLFKLGKRVTLKKAIQMLSSKTCDLYWINSIGFIKLYIV